MCSRSHSTTFGPRAPALPPLCTWQVRTNSPDEISHLPSPAASLLSNRAAYSWRSPPVAQQNLWSPGCPRQWLAPRLNNLGAEGWYEAHTKASGQRNSVIASSRNLMLVPPKGWVSLVRMPPMCRESDGGLLEQAFPFFPPHLLFPAQAHPCGLSSGIWTESNHSPTPTALPR